MEYAFKIIDEKNSCCGQIVHAYMPVSQYDRFVTEHPELERYFESAPAISYNGRYFGGLDAQMPGGFKEVLAKIGEANPATELGDNYRKNKTIKEIKTRDVVREYAKKQSKKQKGK
jgi:hypothetical protein